MRAFSTIGTRRRTQRTALAAAVLLAGAATTACATLRATLHGYELGPNGIARPQHRLRQALVAGDFVRALAWREDDALLDRMIRATSAYYAGQYLRAGALLDTAALLSDDRITERLSREALAVLTNDNARPYRPRRTERLFIPYYGMLAYARAGSWEDAAVEARRLAALLAQYDGDRDDGERPLHAVLSHLAGAVLERAGRADEAQVAYRAAHLILAQAPEPAARPGRDEGEVLVVLERGFVAHRVTERIDVYVGDDEHRRDHGRADRDERSGSTQSGDDPRRTTSAIGVLGAGAILPSDSGKVRPRRRKHDDDADYWLAVAFPTLRRSGRSSGATVRVRVENASQDAVRLYVIDGGISRTVELGTVTVRPGMVTIVPFRVWKEGPPTPGTIAAR
jgi:hypothetical protein